MFGRNKVSQEEIENLKQIVAADEKFFEETQAGKEMFEATVSELKESYHQMEAGVSQVCENIQAASELAADNVEMELRIGQEISEYRQKLADWDARQAQVLSEFHELGDKVTALVDENKHFTSPSKFISAYPANARTQNEATGKCLDEMEEYSKQMGVLALNAAIEAGRLGEAGKQFVTAAEDIRTYAARYDTVITDARQQLTESEEQIRQLEEQVHRLVALLKDNNVSTAKLMKTCRKFAQDADRLSGSFASDELGVVYNQVTTLRNADEEIVKSEERNRIRMDDMSEEFLAQQKNQKELLQMTDAWYRHSKERKKETE
jgi:hypothetical protein